MSDHLVTKEQSSRNLALAGAILFVGLVALFTGVPRMMAGLYSNPYDDVFGDIARDRPVTPDLLSLAETSRHSAIPWTENSALYADLAVLRLAAASRAPVFSAQRRRLAGDAHEFQQKALALAPGDGFGWVRLLQTMAVTAAPVADVERVLDVSLERASSHPTLVLTRIAIVGLYWRGLSPAMKDRMGRQFILAARWSPTSLFRIARARQIEDAVAGYVASDPITLARYNYVRARIRSQAP
jgi:hypothetical protein